MERTVEKGDLITVIIPAFNRASLLSRAIESALRQTYKNTEIIVVDDASRDNTGKIVAAFNSKKIFYFRHNQNKGTASAKNTGIKKAGGKYIAFLDSDDEWFPVKLERQIAVFESVNTQAGLVFTNGFNGEKESCAIDENVPGGIVYDPRRDKFFPLRVLINPPSSWMLPTDVIKDIGYFDEGMNNWEDGDYLTRVALKYPIYFLNEKLVNWYATPGHANVVSPSLIAGKEKFLKNNLDALKEDREYLFKFYRALGKDALKIDKKKARKYLLKALRLKPLDSSAIGKLLKSIVKST